VWNCCVQSSFQYLLLVCLLHEWNTSKCNLMWILAFIYLWTSQDEFTKKKKLYRQQCSSKRNLDTL
jgi:hypothetical protein